jgi:hypothetical protein
MLSRKKREYDKHGVTERRGKPWHDRGKKATKTGGKGSMDGVGTDTNKREGCIEKRGERGDD